MRSFRIGFWGLLLALAPGLASAQVVLSPVHYDIAFELNFEAEVLQGTARIVVQNPSQAPVREASLLLYRLLRAEMVHDGHGKSLAFSQAVVAFVDFPVRQVNQVLVALPEPLAPGAQTTIEVQYAGYLLGYVETGELYIKDRIDPAFTILRDDGYAYPRPGVPSSTVNRSAPRSSYSYSARITVPEGLTVANGGRRAGVDTSGAKVTFRYSSLKPSWRMDFAIAKYTELTAGPFRVFHLPGDAEGATRVARAAEQSLGLYTSWFGPLREPTTLTFIEIPDGWGSQADITTIIQSAAAFKDPKQLREVYHEVSHLWGVSPADRPSPRWDEGLASYLEYVVTQELTGTPIVDARANQLLEWLRGELPTHPAWRTVPLVDYGKAGMTDLSYSVGALYFDLLYRLAGREAFNRIIGGFAAKLGGGGGTTRDLVDIVRRTAAMDLSEFSNDWILTTNWADRVKETADIRAIEAYYRRRQRSQE